MARQLFQNEAVQSTFRDRIREKQEKERSAVTSKVEESIPLLGSLLAPLASLMHDLEQGINQGKGDFGEMWVLQNLLQGLPDTWVIFHNAVIEPEPEAFAQIDHLLLGPPGLYLIETKTWRGSFAASRDQWKRRDGQRWVPCASPTAQASRHATLVRRWLGHVAPSSLPPCIENWCQPLVVFTIADWLGVNTCTVPVFDGTQALLAYLASQRARILSAEHIATLGETIAQAAPSPAPSAPETREQSVPMCKQCNIPMVMRISRQGKFAGQQFYGCKNYPTCREIVPFSR